tara:strand:+ start:160 stop:681 length:522 start_codon:yes stop_codon:yes gene_type:complete
MLDLSKVVNWEKVFRVIDGTQSLKRNQTRPLRTEIIEMSIDKYSGGKLKYVGDTADGMDFDGVDGIRYECKLQNKIFQPRTLHTAKVTLKNHRSKKQEIKQTFDKMIFIDEKQRKVGVVDYDNLKVQNLDAVANCWVDDWRTKVDMIAENVSKTQSNSVNLEKIIFDKIKEVI